MAKEEKAIEVEKQEITPSEIVERTRETRCFIPGADIYEMEDKIVIAADLPGVDEDSIDITLENNTLTINGFVEPYEPEGYSLVYGEYEVGDYQRSFKLSNDIDRDKIVARIKDGVLQLHVPKAEHAKLRKISVKAG